MPSASHLQSFAAHEATARRPIPDHVSDPGPRDQASVEKCAALDVDVAMDSAPENCAAKTSPEEGELPCDDAPAQNEEVSGTARREAANLVEGPTREEPAAAPWQGEVPEDSGPGSRGVGSGGVDSLGPGEAGKTEPVNDVDQAAGGDRSTRSSGAWPKFSVE